MMQEPGYSGFEIRKMQETREAGLCAELMASSEPWKTLGRDYESALKLVLDPSRDVYLALSGTEILGFVVIVMQGAFVGYIQTLVVMREWRNRGVGSALLDYAEALIFRQSPNVFICVSSFNEAARRLYERCGYRVVGTLDDYVISGHSEILMRKTIGPLSGFKKEP
jgi:[ribosomal protein S18]-alanine N-acetyltransferase